MEGVIALSIPIFIVMIPIVAILTRHQQRMAELMRGGPSAPDPNQALEMDKLRQDMNRLQNVVSTLAINVENLKDEVRSGGVIQDRLHVSE